VATWRLTYQVRPELRPRFRRSCLSPPGNWPSFRGCQVELHERFIPSSIFGSCAATPGAHGPDVVGRRRHREAGLGRRTRQPPTSKLWPLTLLARPRPIRKPRPPATTTTLPSSSKGWRHKNSACGSNRYESTRSRRNSRSRATRTFRTDLAQFIEGESADQLAQPQILKLYGFMDFGFQNSFYSEQASSTPSW
jgi:hypothetical protein